MIFIIKFKRKMDSLISYLTIIILSINIVYAFEDDCFEHTFEFIPIVNSRPSASESSLNEELKTIENNKLETERLSVRPHHPWVPQTKMSLFEIQSSSEIQIDRLLGDSIVLASLILEKFHSLGHKPSLDSLNDLRHNSNLSDLNRKLEHLITSSEFDTIIQPPTCLKDQQMSISVEEKSSLENGEYQLPKPEIPDNISSMKCPRDFKLPQSREIFFSKHLPIPYILLYIPGNERFYESQNHDLNTFFLNDQIHSLTATPKSSDQLETIINMPIRKGGEGENNSFIRHCQGGHAGYYQPLYRRARPLSFPPSRLNGLYSYQNYSPFVARPPFQNLGNHKYTGQRAQQYSAQNQFRSSYLDKTNSETTKLSENQIIKDLLPSKDKQGNSDSNSQDSCPSIKLADEHSLHNEDIISSHNSNKIKNEGSQRIKMNYSQTPCHHKLFSKYDLPHNQPLFDQSSESMYCTSTCDPREYDNYRSKDSMKSYENTNSDSCFCSIPQYCTRSEPFDSIPFKHNKRQPISAQLISKIDGTGMSQESLDSCESEGLSSGEIRYKMPPRMPLITRHTRDTQNISSCPLKIFPKYDLSSPFERERANSSELNELLSLLSPKSSNQLPITNHPKTEKPLGEDVPPSDLHEPISDSFVKISDEVEQGSDTSINKHPKRSFMKKFKGIFRQLGSCFITKKKKDKTQE